MHPSHPTPPLANSISAMLWLLHHRPYSANFSILGILDTFKCMLVYFGCFYNLSNSNLHYRVFNTSIYGVFKKEKNMRIQVQAKCCVMSTETKRTTRDRETRTVTSTFLQLLSWWRIHSDDVYTLMTYTLWWLGTTKHSSCNCINTWQYSCIVLYCIVWPRLTVSSEGLWRVHKFWVARNLGAGTKPNR